VTGAGIRLLQLHEACDRDGVPRAALLVPPLPNRYGVRPTTVMFPSLNAALEAKRQLELEAVHASPA